MKDDNLLPKEALTVLLDLFETSSRAITGSVLYKKYPRSAKKLIEDRWLIPKNTLSFIEVNGKLEEVFWRWEASAYQYFSPFLGWTTVSPNLLKRYTVNMEKCLFWLLDLFKIKSSSRAVMLYEDTLCHLGMTCTGNINVYLCSRLKNIKTFSVVTNTLKKRSAAGPAVVITVKSGAIPLSLPDNMREITFRSLLSKDSFYCKIDQHAIERILFNDQPSSTLVNKKQLYFSEDYRLVYWGKKKYVLTKKQAAVVEALHNAGGRAHKDFLQAQADTDTELHRIMRNRIDGRWVQHPLWDTLIIKSGGGYYSFNDNVVIESQSSLFQISSL